MQRGGFNTQCLFELVVRFVVRADGVLRVKFAPDLELKFKFPIGAVCELAGSGFRLHWAK